MTMNHPRMQIPRSATNWPWTRRTGSGLAAMSRFISSLILLVIFAVAAAQPVEAQTDSANSKASSNKKPFAKVEIEGFDGSQYQKKLRKDGFSASGILDVVLKTRLMNCSVGDHLLELELYNPNGHLYETLPVPITVDSKKGNRPVTVEGFPRPITSQAVEKGNRPVTVEGFPRPITSQAVDTNAQQGSDKYYVTATLEVAGTYITTNSLYGTWEIKALLDGEQLRLIGDQSFIIRP
jgi:hypothetical protein